MVAIQVNALSTKRKGQLYPAEQAVAGTSCSSLRKCTPPVASPLLAAQITFPIQQFIKKAISRHHFAITK